MLKSVRSALAICLVLTLAVTATYAQQQDQEADRVESKPKTKLEAFSAKDGAVVIKGSSAIGKVSAFSSSVEVFSKEFTDASTGQKQYGIVVEVSRSSGGALGSRESRSYIDYDEIESLVAGIDYITKLDNSVTKMTDFEADYRTKDDLRLSVFSSTNGASLFGNPDKKSLSFYVESGTVGSVAAILKLDAAKQLRDLIVKAKEKIDSVRGN